MQFPETQRSRIILYSAVVILTSPESDTTFKLPKEMAFNKSVIRKHARGVEHPPFKKIQTLQKKNRYNASIC